MTIPPSYKKLQHFVHVQYPSGGVLLAAITHLNFAIRTPGGNIETGGEGAKLELVLDRVGPKGWTLSRRAGAGKLQLVLEGLPEAGPAEGTTWSVSAHSGCISGPAWPLTGNDLECLRMLCVCLGFLVDAVGRPRAAFGRPLVGQQGRSESAEGVSGPTCQDTRHIRALW